jgi:hypothetical protein
MDHYTKWLTEAVDALEKIYGLDLVVDGKKLVDMDIMQVAEHTFTCLEGKGKSFIEEKNVIAFNMIGFIAHLSARMEFYSHAKIEFRNFPMLGEVSEAMHFFLYEDRLDASTRDNGDIIATVLDRIDKKHLDLRYSLGYRYLRLFVLVLLYSGYTHLSILSRFLISQIERGNSNVGKDRLLNRNDRKSGQT